MRLRKDLVSRFADGWPYEASVCCPYCGRDIPPDDQSNASDQGVMDSTTLQPLAWYCRTCKGFWVRHAVQVKGVGQRVKRVSRYLG